MKNKKKSVKKQGQSLGGGTGEGPGGICVCVDCGKRFQHKTGVPCNKLMCPECGGAMTREVEKENMSTGDAGALVPRDMDSQIEPRYTLLEDEGPFHKSVFYDPAMRTFAYQIRFLGEHDVAAGGHEKTEKSAIKKADEWQIVLMDRIIGEAQKIRKGMRTTADPQARKWVETVLASSYMIEKADPRLESEILRSADIIRRGFIDLSDELQDMKQPILAQDAARTGRTINRGYVSSNMRQNPLERVADKIELFTRQVRRTQATLSPKVNRALLQIERGLQTFQNRIEDLERA